MIHTLAIAKRLEAAGIELPAAQAITEEFASNEEKIATKSDLHDLEERLNGRIEGVEQRINGRIEGVEQRLNGRIKGVEQRIKGVEQRINGLDRRIDTLEQHTAERISDLKDSVRKDSRAVIRTVIGTAIAGIILLYAERLFSILN